MYDLTIALEEEIGNPDLFTGRSAELGALLNWCEQAKDRMSKSKAILSRRKKGKTALIQRLFNILYTKNDPQIVPFFFRVKEQDMYLVDFAVLFYRSFMSQFVGYIHRDLSLFRNIASLAQLEELVAGDPVLKTNLATFQDTLATTPNLAWDHARDTPLQIAAEKDIRIIQMIDEYQFLNRYLFADPGLSRKVNICHSYMAAAESKVAPMIVTGSYIGWLDTILNHMTSRFEKEVLHALTDGEAVETAYNYAARLGIRITDETADYIARVGHNDPFYISQIIRTKQPDVDLTTKAGVRSALQFETTPEIGYIANVWMEYILDAFHRVNEINAKKVVLYLAKYHNESRTRKQIIEDLNLDMAENELEARLYKLYMADLIARGASASRYKGLGDPVFEAVFRKMYGEDIEEVDYEVIEQSFEEDMRNLKRQTAWQKGINGEYKVRYHLLAAATRGVPLNQIVANPMADARLTPYRSMNKERISVSTDQSREVDIYARSEDADGYDLIIEVKNHEKHVANKDIEAFIELKNKIRPETAHTGFLFYSENGFTSEQQARLQAEGIMYSDKDRLAAYEQGTD